MGRKLFKVLIPIYAVWFITHMSFFFYFIISQINAQTPPNLTNFGLLMLSHVLVIIVGSAFTIWMIIDCALRKFRNDTDKIVWLIVVILLNFIGSIIYFYVHGKKPLNR